MCLFCTCMYISLTLRIIHISIPIWYVPTNAKIRLKHFEDDKNITIQLTFYTRNKSRDIHICFLNLEESLENKIESQLALEDIGTPNSLKPWI